jgi:hypothetical protein
MRWAKHVASMREKRDTYRLMVGKSEDQDVGGWIILGWILERWDGAMWTGFHKMLGNYGVAFRVVLSSIELVSLFIVYLKTLSISETEQ